MVLGAKKTGGAVQPDPTAWLDRSVQRLAQEQLPPEANDAALILAARTLGINLQKLHTRYEQQMDFDQGNDDPYAYR